GKPGGISQGGSSLDTCPADCYPCCLASGSYAEYVRLRSKDLADATGARLKPALVQCEVSGFRPFVACLPAGGWGGFAGCPRSTNWYVVGGSPWARRPKPRACVF